MNKDWDKIKQSVVTKIINLLEDNLLQLDEVAQSAKENINSQDMKQESKYDTRAIEASYLQGAQLARLKQIKLDMTFLKSMKLQVSNVVSTGSLVLLRIDNQEMFYFITPVSTLKTIEIEGVNINLVTVSSPFGQGLLNLEVGDDFLLELNDTELLYQVVSIL